MYNYCQKKITGLCRLFEVLNCIVCSLSLLDFTVHTHDILSVESDGIMWGVVVYEAKYKLLDNRLHYLYCSFDS